MYFNAQRARKPGLRTTSYGWVSIYPLSQIAGRVIQCIRPLTCCLTLGVQSKSFPRTPFSVSGVLPSPRSGQVFLDEAEHFPAQSRCQRRYAPMVFGIIPECRSGSLRNKRLASPESPVVSGRPALGARHFTYWGI
jgi:hypothetical protein